MQLDVAYLGGEISRFGLHLEDVLERCGATRKIGVHEHGGKAFAVVDPARHLDCVVADDGAPEMVALSGQGKSEAGENASAEHRVTSGESCGGLFEELDCTLVEHAGAPTRLLKPNRGPRKELAVPNRARGLACLSVRVDRFERLAGSNAGGAELKLYLCVPTLAVDAEVESRPQSGGCFVVVERGRRGLRGEQVVRDCPLASAQGRGDGEVMREVGQHRSCRRAVGSFERLRDAEVQLGPTGPAEPVVERPADELVREAVRNAARRDLLDQPAALRRLEALERRKVAGVWGGSPQGLELELGARDGGEVEELSRGRR